MGEFCDQLLKARLTDFVYVLEPINTNIHKLETRL